MARKVETTSESQVYTGESQAYAGAEGEEELGSCSLCDGPLVPLGQLGSLAHSRCLDCGAEFSHRTGRRLNPGPRGALEGVGSVLQLMGGLPPNVLQQWPNGRYGFVGSVDARLRFQHADGSPPTLEEIRELQRTSSVRVTMNRHGLSLRSFATPEEAQEFAASLERENPGPRGGRTKVQSLLIPKDKMSALQARQWASKHGFKASKVDEGAGRGEYHRIRQYAPKKGERYRTIEFGRGIKAVVGATGRRNPAALLTEDQMMELARELLEMALEPPGRPILLIGPPGVGKTMIGRRIGIVLDELGMDPRVAAEATVIHRDAGLLHETGQLTAAPFRAPHHTVSVAGMRGQLRPKSKTFVPGECSLAHGGVLFLDEAPEFQRMVLEEVNSIYRDGFAQFAGFKNPAEFVLVLAANPCPCGSPRGGVPCTCTTVQVARYLERVTKLFPDVLEYSL